MSISTVHTWHSDCWFSDLHPSGASRSSVFSERPSCLENSCLPVDRRDRSRWCALPPLLHCIFLGRWKVTEPKLWRCWCQPRCWWSGCSEMLSGSREASSAWAHGDCPRRGSDPGVPGGWWSPWWSDRLCSWSCCCCPVSGSGWNDQTD